MKRLFPYVCCLAVLFFAAAHLVEADGNGTKCALTLDDFKLLNSNGAAVWLMQDIAGALSVLGTPNSSSLRSWGYREYSYDGLIVALPKGKKQVFLYRVKSDGYRTSRGVAVGDRKVDVFRLYDSRCFVLASDGTSFVSQVKVTDGKVDEDQDFMRFDDTRSRIYSLAFAFADDRVSEIVINIALQD
jgi:hypothetical protein